MHARLFGVVAVVAAGLLALPAARAEQPKEVKEVIDKVIEAHGGAEALKKYPAERTKSKGTVTVMNMDFEFTSETATMLPDSARTVIDLEIGGNKVKVVQVYSNGKARITANGTDTPLEKGQLEELKQSAHLSRVSQWHTLLDDKTYTVTLMDKPEKVGDKETVGLLVKAKGFEDIKLLFDKKTNLLAQVEMKGRSPEGEAGTQRMVFGGYKKFDGVQHPTTIEAFHEGKKFLSATTTEVKHLEKIDKKEFDLSD